MKKGPRKDWSPEDDKRKKANARRRKRKLADGPLPGGRWPTERQQYMRQLRAEVVTPAPEVPVLVTLDLKLNHWQGLTLMKLLGQQAGGDCLDAVYRALCVHFPEDI